ncbi:sterol carrier family protein [Kitasatospora sp. NPDC002227]|uniref:maleylpyruvate isomerase family mycothiol-dependent enzyme n=1 Tax=Kitasatospora sp. NPDC002227 TaxID=3154773 RepID=UPI00332792B9
MPPKPRTYDPAKVRAALVAQTEAVRAAVRRLSPADLDRPTRLGEWRVRELVAHLAVQAGWAARHLDDPLGGKPELSLAGWVAGVGELAPLLDEAAREQAAAASVVESFEAEAAALLALLDGPLDGARRFEIRLGSMPLADFLVTRLVELVVHADDLADALGVAFPHARQALAAVSRLLADAFATQVPGGAVELRVPPFAVVQAVPGPRHTRGTPPNVVETDPLTWIRLATGRLSWPSALEDAVLSASGERSDLSAYLPVMR